MKGAMNLRERNLLDLERDVDQDGLPQLSRDAVEPLRERVSLRGPFVWHS